MSTPLSPLSPAGHNSRRKSPPASMSALASVDAILSSPRSRQRSRNFTPFDMLYSTPTKDPKAGKEIVIFEDENTPAEERQDFEADFEQAAASTEAHPPEESMVGDDAILPPSSPFVDEIPNQTASTQSSRRSSIVRHSFTTANEIAASEPEPRPNDGLSSPVKKKSRLSGSLPTTPEQRNSPRPEPQSQNSTMRLKQGFSSALDQTKQEQKPIEYQKEADAPTKGTMRFNEGLTAAVDSWASESCEAQASGSLHDDTINLDTELGVDEGMSTIFGNEQVERTTSNESHDNARFTEDEQDNTLSLHDDSCLSTFSAVPNLDMTQFASLRHSPIKTLNRDTRSPNKKAREEVYRSINQTPNTIKRSHSARDRSVTGYDNDQTSPAGSPTPRRTRAGTVTRHNENEHSSNLIDFTGELNAFIPPSHSRPFASPSRARRERISMLSPFKGGVLRTPARGGAALLDFDIPPAPTPRSMPTISARELESLKSKFLSEISSLKATLSGKEAESASLKTAVTDAERRVGEALEEVRDLRSAKEGLEMDKKQWDDWKLELDKRIVVMKEDSRRSDRDKATLTMKVDEAERKREKADARVVELQNLLESARAQIAASASASTDPTTPATRTQPARDTDKEIGEAVEKVARELHTLYKGKHEKKVAALKRSYESRWEKRVAELEQQVSALKEEINHLQSTQRSSYDHHHGEDMGEMTMLNNEFEADKRVLEARIAGLESELASLKSDSESLRSQLEMERTEKGELVAVVDEWIGLQEIVNDQQQQRVAATPAGKARAPIAAPTEQEIKLVRERAVEHEIDTLKRSVGYGGTSRPPGLGLTHSSSAANIGSSNSNGGGLPQPSQRKIPGPSGESRIGRFGAPAGANARGKSAANAGGASGIGGPRSGIMSSIERMGRGGG